MKAVNVNLPDELFTDMNQFADDAGLSKKEVVSQALRQFLALKSNEQDFRDQHPGHRISTTVTFKAHKDRKPKGSSSIMIY